MDYLGFLNRINTWVTFLITNRSINNSKLNRLRKGIISKSSHSIKEFSLARSTIKWSMVKVCCYPKNRFSKGNSTTMYDMLDASATLMVSTKAIIWTESDQATEFLNGTMEKCMKVNGKMEQKMVMVYGSLQKAISIKDSGF